jgi:hypothetical protein
MEAYKAGNYETCAVELKQLIAESPAPYTSVYYNAACCLAMAGHPDEAMIYFAEGRRTSGIQGIQRHIPRQ